MTTEPLKGRARWLTGLSTLAVTIGAAVAAIYGWLTLTIPPGAGWSFVVWVVVVVVGLNILGDWLEQRRLLALRRLGRGEPKTQPLLLEAAHAVATQSDHTFRVVLASYLGGSAAIALLWLLTSPVSVWTAARLIVVGFTIAPVTALLANLSVLPRARIVLGELVEAGLERSSFAKVEPAQYDLRQRFTVFAMVAALTPMVLIIDMTVSRFFAEVSVHDAALQGGTGVAALTALAVMLLLIVGMSAYLGGGMLADPLTALSAQTTSLAQGAYGAGRFVAAEGETWAAATALSDMGLRVEAALSQLVEMSRGIALTSSDLVSGRTIQQAGSEEQSASLAATTATTEELARSARHIASSAQRVNDLAKETLAAARTGKHNADAFTEAMNDVRGGNQAIADSVVRLNKRVQQVGRIIEFIDGIADKSDLLALNAELEGHKAGEVGRGFGLVAAEMRRLAESVLSSTAEIARLIEEIRDATNAAVMATEAGVKATEAGAWHAQGVSQSLTRIVDFANTSADAMQAISLATEQQQQGTDQLVMAMAEILKSTSEGVEATREMAEAERKLLAVSKELGVSVGELKVKS